MEVRGGGGGNLFDNRTLLANKDIAVNDTTGTDIYSASANVTTSEASNIYNAQTLLIEMYLMDSNNNPSLLASEFCDMTSLKTIMNASSSSYKTAQIRLSYMYPSGSCLNGYFQIDDRGGVGVAIQINSAAKTAFAGRKVKIIVSKIE